MSASFTKAYKLLGVLQDYAPNQEARILCSKMLNEMRADKLPEPQVEERLVDAISDGLKYGNWPWVDVNKKEGN